jgi:hypothetical protein
VASEPGKGSVFTVRGRVVGFVLDRGVAGFESYDAAESRLPVRPRRRAISAVREFRSDASR